jgi:transcription initiation factor TFIID subunit 2
MEAAYAMARGYSSPSMDHVGIRQLLLAYRKKFASSREPTRFVFELYPRRNDFRALTEYFVQKAIISAMSMIRHDNGECPREIKRFLISQLQLNDNQGNEFSDNYYVASLIEAVGSAFMPTKQSVTNDSGELKLIDNVDVLKQIRSDSMLVEALAEINRHLFLETQIPSYHNVVAQECLDVLIKFMSTEVIPTSVKPFLLFSLPGNYISVRQACFDALILFGWGKIDVAHFLLDVVESDEDYKIRNYLAGETYIASFILSNLQIKCLWSRNFSRL